MYSPPPPKIYYYPRSKPLLAARQSSLGPLLRPQPSSCASGCPCAHPLGPRLPFLASDCGSGPARAPFFRQPSSKRDAARFASPCRPSANPARLSSCAVCIAGSCAYSTPHNTVQYPSNKPPGCNCRLVIGQRGKNNPIILKRPAFLHIDTLPIEGFQFSLHHNPAYTMMMECKEQKGKIRTGMTDIKASAQAPLYKECIQPTQAHIQTTAGMN